MNYQHMNIANASENIVKEVYEKAGYSVIDSGWPDFLCYRLMTDSNLPPVIELVEVKSEKDNLHGSQPLMIDLLRRAGLSVKVIRVSKEGKLTFMCAPLIGDVEALRRKKIRRGLETARSRGKVLGRPAARFSPEKLKYLMESGYSLKAAARILGISAATVCRRWKEAKQNLNGTF